MVATPIVIAEYELRVAQVKCAINCAHTRRFPFAIESRCVIAAAARTGRVAACLQLRGIKDARN
jgi:hypothetical protein